MYEFTETRLSTGNVRSFGFVVVVVVVVVVVHLNVRLTIQRINW